jgi:hypothetical protein
MMEAETTSETSVNFHQVHGAASENTVTLNSNESIKLPDFQLASDSQAFACLKLQQRFSVSHLSFKDKTKHFGQAW